MTDGPHAAKDPSWRPTRGWLPASAIRYAKLRTLRGLKDLVVTPEQLKVYGKSYTSAKLCGGNLFTEVASFYLTGDAKRPIAVLCTGNLDGEANSLSIVGKGVPPVTEKIDPPESSSSIAEKTLIDSLDIALLEER